MLWRRGSRLSSSAAVLIGSNFGVGLGGGGFLTGGGSACLGGGGGSAAFAISCFFSTTFGVASSFGGLGSATFSTNGFGVVTFSAFLTPLVSWLNSVAEMMSTGTESVTATS